MNSRLKFVSRATWIALGVFAAATAAFASPPPWARANVRYERQAREPVYARVVDVEPIVHRVRITTPNRECWNETQEVYPSRPANTAGSMILGGLIGGVIGHQIGHGYQRQAPTVAGALVGAAIGNQVGQQNANREGYGEPLERQVERCNVSYHDEYEERIDGYRVTYEYDGREYTTRMAYDPGKRIRINVAVSPDFRGDDRED